MVADDHPVVLDGLEAILQRKKDIELVGTARDGNEAVALVLKARPDVAVLDIRMPNCDGVEATERILARFPDARIIILSAMEDLAIAVQAFRAGAVGFMSKSTFGKLLVEGIEMAAEGKAVVTADMVRHLARSDGGSEVTDPLTTREKSILSLVTEGKTNTQIARAVGMSVSTVKAQLSTVFEKLGAIDRASAVAICFRRGWLV